jgi:hypothetical protein
VARSLPLFLTNNLTTWAIDIIDRRHVVHMRILTCIRINCIQSAFARPSAVRTITTISPTIPHNLTPLVFQMVTERQPLFSPLFCMRQYAPASSLRGLQIIRNLQTSVLVTKIGAPASLCLCSHRCLSACAHMVLDLTMDAW